MLSPSDPRIIFFAFCGLLALNCDPSTYLAAPNCTDTHVEEYLRRFEPVRSAVADNLQLGYVAGDEQSRIEVHQGEKTTNVDLNALRRFFMAQYILAPRILLHDSSQPIVLGNFATDKDGMIYAAKNQLHVKQSFGRGVFLFTKRNTNP